MHERTRSIAPTIREGRRLGFYAALFDSPATLNDFRPGYSQRTWFTEIIRPGAFTDSLRTNTEVLANVNHDPGRTYAKRSDGSLLLQQDPVGLYASCWLPEDDLGDAVLADVKAGRLDSTSFRFNREVDNWQGDTREIVSLALHDVTLTARPAYPQTRGEVHLRSSNSMAALLARYNFAKIKASLSKYHK
jgi:HK97 family phage prohead protease